MTYRIIRRVAYLHKGKWIPEIHYYNDGKPAILEGDPRHPYNTRDEDLKALPQLEADLLDVLTGRSSRRICWTRSDAEPPPPTEESAACGEEGDNYATR